MKKTLCIFVSTLAMAAFLATSVQAQALADTNGMQAQVENSNDGVVSDTAKVVTAPTDDEIRKMNIFDACKALGVSPVYNERYDAIIMPLCAAGVIMFPASSNPYSDPKSDGATRALITEYNGPEYADCYWYVGTGAQNATLIRNMVANKHLIKNGKLVPGAAKKWKVVK